MGKSSRKRKDFTKSEKIKEIFRSLIKKKAFSKEGNTIKEIVEIIKRENFNVSFIEPKNMNRDLQNFMNYHVLPGGVGDKRKANDKRDEKKKYLVESLKTDLTKSETESDETDNEFIKKDEPIIKIKNKEPMEEEKNEEIEFKKIKLTQKEQSALLPRTTVKIFTLKAYISAGNPKDGLTFQEIYSHGDLTLTKDHKKDHVLYKVRRYIVETKTAIFEKGEKNEKGGVRYILLKDPNQLLEEIQNNKQDQEKKEAETESYSEEEEESTSLQKEKEILIQPKFKNDEINPVVLLGWKIDLKTDHREAMRNNCFICKKRLKSNSNHLNCCRSKCKKIFHQECISNYKNESDRYVCGSHSCFVCKSQNEMEWKCNYCFKAFCPSHFTKGYSCDCCIQKK